VEMEGVGEPRREKGPLDLFLILLFNSSNLKSKNKTTAFSCDFIFWWRWRELNPRPIIFPYKILRV